MSEELDAFHKHLDELSSEAGVELDPGDRQRILGASFELGFGPDSTERLFSEIVEADYGDVEEDDSDEPDAQLTRHLEDGIGRFESQHGRKLTKREAEIVYDGSLAQIDHQEWVDPQKALDEHYQANPGEKRADTSTQEGRSEFYRQRLSEPTPEAPERELDLDKSEDRIEFMQARLNGHEFEDTDS